MAPLNSPPDSPPSSPVSNGKDTPSKPPSEIKLAMRNMVKKGGKSLQHFGLTVTALLGALVGLAYLTR